VENFRNDVCVSSPNLPFVCLSIVLQIQTPKHPMIIKSSDVKAIELHVLESINLCIPCTSDVLECIVSHCSCDHRTVSLCNCLLDRLVWNNNTTYNQFPPDVMATALVHLSLSMCSSSSSHIHVMLERLQELKRALNICTTSFKKACDLVTCTVQDHKPPMVLQNTYGALSWICFHFKKV
jgi:hypothetical protein